MAPSGPTGGDSLPSSGRHNSLGLGTRELAALLQLLDSLEQKRNRREQVRMPYRKLSIPVRVTHPGGSTAIPVLMAARNISSTGINLLHNAYVHPGSKCTITLTHLERGEIGMDASVLRCEHVRDLVHEVTLKFVAPINLREYVKPDPFSDFFSIENVDPAGLEGSLVYVDDSAIDHTLLAHYLKPTKLRLRSAMNAQQGLDMIRSGCDMAIVDFDMPGTDGVAMISQLRGEGFSTPILIVTSDTSPASRARLTSVNTSAILAKPLSPELLLRAIAEFLVVGTANGPLSCSLPSDHPNYSLVPSYLEQLRQYATRLMDAIEKEDATACRSICFQITGSAPSVGFGQLALLAEQANRAVAASMSPKESATPLRALISACERAKVA